MKWKTKPRIKDGDIRTRFKFLLWPTECTDGMTRLFETVILTERYTEYCYAEDFGKYWYPIQYESIEDYYAESGAEDPKLENPKLENPKPEPEPEGIQNV